MSAWLLSVTAILAGCSTRSDRAESWSQEVPGGSDAVAQEDGSDVDASSAAASDSIGDDGAASESATPPEVPTDEAESQAEAEALARAEAEALARDEAESDAETDDATASAEPPPEAPASLISLPDANISIQGVEADGQRLDVLQCRASNLPLFGSMVVVASIADQKRALDRCAPEGGAVALRWRLDQGKAHDFTVEHASSDRVGACVAKAMKKVTAPFSAECGAVVLVGKPAGADAALAALRSAAGQ